MNRTQAERRRTGIFRDTIRVYTSALGTQSVKPIELLFPDHKWLEYVKEARERYRNERAKREREWGE